MESLEPLLNKFARDLGNTAALIRPFHGDSAKTKHDILMKDWNGKEKKELKKHQVS